MDALTLRAMPLDDYAGWMLEHGYYDVDVTTGIVTNARTGRPLRPQATGTGYHHVMLVYGSTCQRYVKVHRLVALKLWGLEAVRGHDVGHRNGYSTINTVDELWLPASDQEHAQHDGRTVCQVKMTWLPCMACGDPNGPIGKHRRTPIRVSGARFGIGGSLCIRCYGRLYRAERRLC